MIKILATPLLSLLGMGPSDHLFLYAFLLSTVATLPFWLIACEQDYKRNEIDNYLCICIMFATIVHAFLFGCIGLGFVDCLLAYFTFRPKEIALVGQADFMMVAHWVTAPFVMGHGSGVMLVSSVVFLICIFSYLVVYRDKDGKRWHRGKMVPIIPPYAITVVLMCIYQYPVSLLFYELGW